LSSTKYFPATENQRLSAGLDVRPQLSTHNKIQDDSRTSGILREPICVGAVPMPMNNKTIRVLLIENDEDDYRLTRELFSEFKNGIELQWVATAEEGLKASSRQEHDVILIAHRLGEHNGLELIHEIQKFGRETPVILLTADNDQAVELAAMEAGAAYCLIKNETRATLLERLLQFIIERKPVNAELRDARSQLEAALDAGAISIWNYDILNDRIFADKNLAQLSSVSPENAEGGTLKSFMCAIHEDDRRRVEEEIATAFKHGEKFRSEYRVIQPNETVRWVTARGRIKRDAEGTAIRMSGVIIDSTERRAAEEEFKLENSFMEALMNNIPDAIYFKDTEGRFMRVNRHAPFKSNSSREEIVGKTDFDYFSEEHASAAFADEQQIIRTGQPIINKEERETYPDGSQVWVSTTKVPIFDEAGCAIGIVGVSRDITEHKLAEIKFRQSEERYRLLFENNPLPMWVFDVETLGFLTINDAAILHYGYSREEFLSMTIKDIRPQGEIPALLESFSTVNRGMDYAGIWKHQKKDGGIIDVEITSHELIFDGRTAELVLANDVTERKVAEESIRFQAHLLDTVNQAVIATDLEGRITYWNQFAEKLYGWNAQEVQGLNVLELLTPQIMAEQASQILSLLGEGISWAGEFKVQRRDGTIFPALVNNSPIIDEQGNRLGIVGISIDITERKLAEHALQQAEARYRSIVEALPAIVYLSQPVPPYTPIYVSPNIAEFGYSRQEWLSQPDLWETLLHQEDRERILQAMESARSQGLETDLEYRIVGRDGTIHWVHDKGRFVSDEYWQGVMLDITKTKELEEQLRQSQKLESVGRLAGGIAHDFNNMLTAINGYSDLTLRLLQDGDPLRHNLEEIKKAGERSASLTHQLLAFSRQQVLQPVVLDLNEIITDTIKMIQRLIGEDVQLVTALNPKAGRVKVDPGQLTQIIMNLAVNARDAMPQGGRLTLETANRFLDPDYASERVGVIPGAYVMLAISDSGTGMNDQIQQHIFEPFFTTKEVGKGTGLGLATVYGIVKQSGGNIGVYSELGVGTTFKIYLPRVIEKAEAAEVREIVDELPEGTETIFLVEDEDLVRALTRQILEMCGYTVFEARNGVEAMTMCEARDCKFDLLMTDVVMPEMGGRELAAKFAQVHPQMRVLFTSGYTDDAIIRHGVIEAGTNFIQKPFTPDALALKIREVLDHHQ
jgi:PAS domain S-box-containing protein